MQPPPFYTGLSPPKREMLCIPDGEFARYRISGNTTFTRYSMSKEPE
jgi:hypothetical protein